MRLTPEPRRSGVYAMYAVMRALDDAADGEEGGPDAGRTTTEQAVPHQAARLEMVASRLDEVAAAAKDASAEAEASASAEVGACPDHLPPGDLWPAVWDTLRRYPIRREWLDAMVQGQRHDLRGVRVQTMMDLTDYAGRVASSVGLICIAIWGYDGQAETRHLAGERGVAMQLVNVLRDVREDARRGRVYLPQTTLAQHHLKSEDVLAAAGAAALPNKNLDHLTEVVRSLAEEAERRFVRSEPLEACVEADCRATSWAMMRVYRDLLGMIRADPERVLRERVTLGRGRKLRIAAEAAWRRWGI